MSKIRYINPSDLGIQVVARKFTKEHPGVHLLDVLDSLSEDEIISLGDETFNYYKRSPSYEKRRTTSVIELNIAVAYAQERLLRKNNEWKELNRLLKENFPLKEREKAACSTITEIADSLCEAKERSEINFLNYLIEEFTYLSQEKEDVIDNGGSVDFDIDHNDLESGENGFRLGSSMSVDIVEILYEAAGINEKE